MPTPTRQELDLLGLLRLERARNGRVAQTQRVELPELHPEMLLSASAQREVKAARQLRGEYTHFAVLDDRAPFPAQPPTAVAQTVARTIQASAAPQRQMTYFQARPLETPQTEMAQLQQLWEFSGDPEQIDPLMGGGRSSVAAAPTQDGAELAGLWANTVPEGAGQLPMMGTAMPAPSTDFDIEFDDHMGGIDLDSGPSYRGVPNERVRFQVGRQDPPPPPRIDRRAIAVDGTVVSTRGSDGRFRAVESPAPIVMPWDGHSGPGIASVRPAPGLVRALDRARPGRAQPIPQPVPIDRSTIPTAMERLGSTPWD